MRLRPKLSFFVLTQTMNILIMRKATLAMNIMITGTVGPQVIHNLKYNGIYLYYGKSTFRNDWKLENVLFKPPRALNEWALCMTFVIVL